MSVRTTVTLDDDIVERVKAASQARGASFGDTLNDLLRVALAKQKAQTEQKPFKIKPFKNSGYYPHLNYDCWARLLEELEGPDYR
jgi:hypothetical protein